MRKVNLRFTKNQLKDLSDILWTTNDLPDAQTGEFIHASPELKRFRKMIDDTLDKFFK